MGTRGRPKVSNRCRTCKVRRVKCDETKPLCRRCTDTGRTCDGYSPEPTLPAPTFSDLRELRTFKYFCESTALELSAHYDEPFWQNVTHQPQCLHPGTRHMIIAVGALHETLTEHTWKSGNISYDNLRPVSALEQCNKAIAMLTQQDPDTTTMLQSCILFMAFEILQNHASSAADQFWNGVRLLDAWRNSDNSHDGERESVEHELAPVLIRFYEASGIELSIAEASHWDVNSEACAREPFQHLTQAAIRLTVLANEGFSQLHERRANPPDPANTELFVSKFQSWEASFTEWLGIKHLNNYDKRRTALLRAQYHAALVLFHAASKQDEMAYDSMTSDFTQVVHFCRLVIDLEAGFSQSTDPQLSPSFDLGILMPLFLTATRCRDPGIRRQALHLLQAKPRREGRWLSWELAAAAEHIMTVEEQGWTDSNPLPLQQRAYVLQIRSETRTRMLDVLWVYCQARPPNSRILSQRRLPPLSEVVGAQPAFWVILPIGLDLPHWDMLLQGAK